MGQMDQHPSLKSINLHGFFLQKQAGIFAAGKFYFTCVANATGKTIEVTHGFFKIFLGK
jgi:hypothetical protein